MAITIGLQGVSRRYGSVTALHELDLEIKAGEFFTLLGSSGSGKSTTLKIIGGFEQPSTGSVFFDGQDVTRTPANRRPCNTVFQNLALFPHMTVAENVGYGLRVQGEAKPRRIERVNDALSLVNLDGYGDRGIAMLSGGQQQRVALARALVMEPGILLLDEPLTGLDEGLRQQMRDEFGRLHEKTGATFVLVTHNQDEALTLSDRMAIMHDGKIEQVGAPEDILNTPNNEFVARFVGLESILVPESIKADGKNFAVSIAGQTYAVPRGGLERTPQKVAIRSDRVRFSETATGVSATISYRHFRGRHHEVGLRLADGAEITAEIPTESMPDGLGIGDEVKVDLQAGAIILMKN